MNSEPTVFVVDDDPGVREGLEILVGSTGRPVETFPDAQAFLQAWDRQRPGCLVLDIRMPGMSGLQLPEQTRARRIDLPVIIITGQGDVPAAVRAMRGGAVDFIEKPFNDVILLDRIARAIAQDDRNRQERVARAQSAERLAQLTPREREVLDLLVAGKTTKQIAARLGISFQAVAAHRNRIMDKLEADNVVDLVHIALTSDAALE